MSYEACMEVKTFVIYQVQHGVVRDTYISTACVEGDTENDAKTRLSSSFPEKAYCKNEHNLDRFISGTFHCPFVETIKIEKVNWAQALWRSLWR